jgi:hypothetical protein
VGERRLIAPNLYCTTHPCRQSTTDSSARRGSNFLVGLGRGCAEVFDAMAGAGRVLLRVSAPAPAALSCM